MEHDLVILVGRVQGVGACGVRCRAWGGGVGEYTGETLQSKVCWSDEPPWARQASGEIWTRVSMKTTGRQVLHWSIREAQLLSQSTGDSFSMTRP